MKNLILFLVIFGTLNAFGGADRGGNPGDVRAEGGDRGGNPGDVITPMFEKARKAAIQATHRINGCSFAKETKAAVRDWVLQNRAYLASVLNKADHNWDKSNEFNSCAMTFPANHPNTIFFTLGVCRGPDMNFEYATKLLIHESVHLMGYDSEKFAWDVAYAIMDAKPAAECEEEDPFSPTSCVGGRTMAADLQGFTSSLEKATNELQLTESLGSSGITFEGPYKLYSRSRKCNNFSGCSQWHKNESSNRTFVTEAGHTVVVPNTGKIVVSMDFPAYQPYIKTVGERRCPLVLGQPYCVLGAGPLSSQDLYEEINGIRQKLVFHTLLTADCVRQHTKLTFRPVDGDSWVEVEHVVFQRNWSLNP